MPAAAKSDYLSTPTHRKSFGLPSTTDSDSKGPFSDQDESALQGNAYHDRRHVTSHYEQLEPLDLSKKAGIESSESPQQHELTEAEEKRAKVEYSNISNGADFISFVKNHQYHRKLLSDILRDYGLRIHRHQMTQDDTRLIADILSHCKAEITMFSFAESTGLEDLLSELKRQPDSTPQVTKVCFAGHPEGNLEEFAKLYVEFANLFKAEVLVLTDVGVSVQGLENLKACIVKTDQGCCACFWMEFLRKLEIFHDVIDERGCEILTDIATHCWKRRKVALHLSVCYSHLKDEHLLAFRRRLVYTKLTGFNISGNRELTDQGILTFGEIAKESEASAVILQDCNLDAKKLRSFNLGCDIDSSPLKIETLNVADNPNLRSEGMEELKKIVNHQSVKNLNIAYCGLYDADFGSKKFESLDISGNPRCTTITKLSVTATKRLFMRNCMLNIPQLRNLKKQMKDRASKQSRLEVIDISDKSKRLNRKTVDFLVQEFKEVTESVTVC